MIRSLLTLWKGCKTVADDHHLQYWEFHWKHSPNLSTVLTDSYPWGNSATSDHNYLPIWFVRLPRLKAKVPKLSGKFTDLILKSCHFFILLWKFCTRHTLIIENFKKWFFFKWNHKRLWKNSFESIFHGLIKRQAHENQAFFISLKSI